MIGFGPEALDRGGLREALGTDAVISVAGGHTAHGTPRTGLDIDALGASLAELADNVEGFAVTSQFGVRNPDHELAARDLIRERTGLPVTCSHELAAGLDGPKRSVTALFNIRLIAMIEELVGATESILAARGIDAPVMVGSIGEGVGEVRIRRQITVTAPRRGVFRVHSGTDPETVHDLETARVRATARGTEMVGAAMVSAGASDFDLETYWHETSAMVLGRELFVEGTVTVTASGRANLG